METQLVPIIIYLLGKHPGFFRITSMAQQLNAFRTEVLDVCVTMFEGKRTGRTRQDGLCTIFFFFKKTVEAFLRNM